MNAPKILSAVMLAAVCAILSVSCEPLEPSTYSERLFRVGTVRLNSLGTKAYIVNDSFPGNSEESFALRNFRTAADMKKFGVENNDRVVAVMDFNAVGSMANAQITLEGLQKIEVSKFAAKRPSDTLNYDYHFYPFALVNVNYTSIWTAGHIVNIAPIYYISESGAEPEFQLDPVVLRNDTLFARLYSYIPDIDMSQTRASQSLLCFDMASLRDSSDDAANQSIRKSILAGLTELKNKKKKDVFTLTIVTPDSLRSYSAGSDDVRWRHPMLDHAVSVSVKFDF